MKTFPWTTDHEREENLLRLALLKERAAYRAFWAEHGGDKVRQAYDKIGAFYAAGNDPGGVFEACSQELETADLFTCGLFEFGLTLFEISPLLEEGLRALDPLNNEPFTRAPVKFEERRAVIQVTIGREPREHCATEPVAIALNPSERLLKIDLSRKKSEIMAELERFLDAVEYFRQAEDVPGRYRKNYDQWEQDASRQKKAWQHLKVWNLRRQRMTFSEIAREMGLSADNAKKSFYAAFELIEGKPYDREQFTALYQKIEAGELLKPCETCPKKPSCDPSLDPCPVLYDWFASPEVVAFVTQDTKAALRENLIGDEKLDFIENQRDMPRRK